MPKTLLTGADEARVEFRQIKNGFIKQTSRTKRGRDGEPPKFETEEEFVAELPEGVSLSA